ncbi:MAG: transcriptional regulator NrdR [Phycisphaerales bacterium JB039]
MLCPFCEADDDRVIDSRAAEGGRVIRRRRECNACSKRFTTYERVELGARLIVVKRDGSRVAFDPEKVYAGVAAACGKRPIPEQVKRGVATQVEEDLARQYEREVPSRVIGERVMALLREIDEVAYIRFASEYHQFKTLEDLERELRQMATHVRDVKDQQSLFEGKR